MADRMTLHSGRTHKGSGKGFNPDHNGRDFELENAKNIREEKTALNSYWDCYGGGYKHRNKDKHMTFRQVEKRYYEEHFKQQWQIQQDRHKAQRQYKRMMDFDDWMRCKNYCPEEICFQIGNKDEHPDEKKLYEAAEKVLQEYLRFAENNNRCYQVLDAAIHMDEAVAHMQFRFVWQSVDENGVLCIGQEDALQRAGIEPTKSDKYDEFAERIMKSEKLSDKQKENKLSRYDNRKITFSKEMRDRCMQLCEELGISIEHEPIPNAEHNLEKDEMLDKKRREELKEHEQNIEHLYKQDAQQKISDFRQKANGAADQIVMAMQQRPRQLVRNLPARLKSAPQRGREQFLEDIQQNHDEMEIQM